MLYLVPVAILSFMHVTCTNTLFHICEASRDGSFFSPPVDSVSWWQAALEWGSVQCCCRIFIIVIYIPVSTRGEYPRRGKTLCYQRSCGSYNWPKWLLRSRQDAPEYFTNVCLARKGGLNVAPFASQFKKNLRRDWSSNILRSAGFEYQNSYHLCEIYYHCMHQKSRIQARRSVSRALALLESIIQGNIILGPSVSSG